MSIETVRQVIARALAEPDFRSLLRSDPGQALADLDLDVEETEALATVEPEIFDHFPARLEPRPSPAVSRPGRPTPAQVQPTGF